MLLGLGCDFCRVVPLSLTLSADGYEWGKFSCSSRWFSTVLVWHYCVISSSPDWLKSGHAVCAEIYRVAMLTRHLKAGNLASKIGAKERRWNFVENLKWKKLVGNVEMFFRWKLSRGGIPFKMDSPRLYLFPSHNSVVMGINTLRRRI